MDTKQRSARMDYEAIEAHIRRAQLMRSAYLGEVIGNSVFAAWNAIKRLAKSLGESGEARERRTLEYDPFLTRNAPHR